jgi:hypothetical protein
MSLVKPFAVLALAICLGLLLAGCQPSAAKAPRQPTLTALVVSPGSASVTVGATQALNVTGGFSDGSTMNLTSTSTFASSAPTVATVSGAGVVTAVKAGVATITVRYPTSSQTATATITVPQPPLVSISMTPATATVATGATQALTVTATYSDASTATLTTGLAFATSNPAIATVSAAGVVAGVAVGTATITATDTASGKLATSAITVSGGGGGSGAFTTITFDSPSVTYTLTGFGGAEDSSVVTDPTGGANKVAKVVKSATAEVWAGTTVSTGPNQSVGKIPFDAANTRMTVRVYSPGAGIKVRLKVEDAADATHSAETDATTTVANAWETLTFDFANPAAGTAPLNFSYTYNKISIFFNFGVAGSTTGAKTYYFDDVAFIGGGGSGGFTTITFDSPTVTYTLTGFGGAEDSSVVPDPTGGANKVAKVVKSATAEVWAGTTVSTGPNNSVGKIPFDAANTRMTVRVYSPGAGIKVRLKVEDAADPTHSAETDATTTVANAWETLTFNFANPAAGTAPLNFSYTYNKISIFFNFGVAGATTGAKTYYFDDVAFIGGTGGGGGGGPIIFASGYASNNRTVENGEWGLYSGNFTSYANTYAGGGFVDGAPPVPAADTYVYLVVTTSAPTTDGYMGIFTAAPGYTTAAPNGGVTLSGQTTLKIELGMSAEWFSQATNKQLLVRFVGTQVYSNGAGGNCQILIEKPVTPTTADLIPYTIALNSMNLAQACNGGGFTSGVNTLAEALAKPIAEIHVQAVFPQVNTTVKAGAEYPTGFTRGSVSFE